MPFSKTEKDCIGKHMPGEKHEQEKVSHRGRKRWAWGLLLSIIELTKGEGKANNHSNHPDE